MIVNTLEQSCGASSTTQIRGHRSLMIPPIHPPSKLRGILGFFCESSMMKSVYSFAMFPDKGICLAFPSDRTKTNESLQTYFLTDFPSRSHKNSLPFLWDHPYYSYSDYRNSPKIPRKLRRLTAW